MERICRVCLQQCKKMVPVSEKPDEIAPSDLADVINECVRYEFKQIEGLPQQICTDCKVLAINAFKFRRKCEEAYKQLVQVLKIDQSLRNFHINAATQTETTSYYPCEHCNEYFSTLIDLMIHQLEAHKNCAIKCFFCKKSLNHAASLHLHMTDFHPEADIQSLSQCYMCNEQFTDTDHMRRHLTSNHKATEAVDHVDDCNQQLAEDIDKLASLPDIEEVDLKIFTENSYILENSNAQDEDLLVYIKQFDDITDDEDNTPLSTLQKADKSNNVFDIIKLENKLEDQKFEDMKTSKSSQLINLILSENDTKEKNVADAKIVVETNIHRKKKNNIIRCSSCEKTFNYAAQLQRHLKTKHQKKIHQCNICDKKFTTATYLQRHVIMHGKKRYSCKECSQNFLTKEELHEHVKTEGHDKRLLCPECGLRCRTSNILMVHLRRHKGEKPFKCKFCSKGFPRSDDLRLHEKYHTGEKSHFCGTCGKGFQRKYNLKIHLRVHTGEKPYKCPHCPQAFAQGNDLKAHIRRHTGERFRCELCDAAFLQGYQIRQHRLSEHGIRDEPPTQRVAKFTSIEAQKQQILQNMNKK